MTTSAEDTSHGAIQVRDLQPASLSSYKYFRGIFVKQARQNLGEPARSYFPLDLFRAYHNLRNRIIPHRYTDHDPFEVFHLDPQALDESVVDRSPKNPEWGMVVDGDWDQSSEPFDDRPVAKGIYQRFGEGRPWGETAYVDAFRQELRRAGVAWGFRSMDGFAERCQQLDELFDTIREDGYLSQGELGMNPLDEINVDIARDGTPLWRCYGQHRLAIARLLGLESVPVLVVRRHALAVEGGHLDVR